MESMNIVFMSDNKFALQAGVTMTSILMNNKDYHIHFHILNKSINDDIKAKLNNLTLQYNCDINFINVDDKCFKNIKSDFDYISIETYYRCL
ncbi:MAG: hypothetical protein LUG16_02980, partial [Candidatus Gastranaerophilales bacterium]|nr:hypothetical protein [Candidatus Gastranaerophilales bacterium]